MYSTIFLEIRMFSWVNIHIVWELLLEFMVQVEYSYKTSPYCNGFYNFFVFCIKSFDGLYAFCSISCMRIRFCEMIYMKHCMLKLKERTTTRKCNEMVKRCKKRNEFLWIVVRNVAWTNCMKELHEPVARTIYTNQLHERVARTSCTNELHKPVARMSCTNQLHERVAWTSCMKELHEWVAWKKFEKKSFETKSCKEK